MSKKPETCAECGNEKIYYQGRAGEWWVFCPTEGCSEEIGGMPTRKKARRAWNKAQRKSRSAKQELVQPDPCFNQTIAELYRTLGSKGWLDCLPDETIKRVADDIVSVFAQVCIQRKLAPELPQALVVIEQLRERILQLETANAEHLRGGLEVVKVNDELLAEIGKLRKRISRFESEREQRLVQVEQLETKLDKAVEDICKRGEVTEQLLVQVEQLKDDNFKQALKIHKGYHKIAYLKHEKTQLVSKLAQAGAGDLQGGGD